MKVLLTQKHPLGSIGGTQSWNRAVGSQIQDRGMEATIAGGLGSDRTWTGDMSWSEWGSDCRFDLAIVSQHATFEYARENADRVVYVSHGIIPHEEPPLGADAYVAVSEEVRDTWDWPQPPAIIRQPINTEFWRPGDRDPDIDVLRVSYYRGLDWLPGLCADMGLSFEHVSDEPEPRKLREWVRRARVVVASGRSALEAMSCGARVLRMDDRPYGAGSMIANSVMDDMRHNYSARGELAVEASAETARIRLAHLLSPEWEWVKASNRTHVLEHHDSGTITDQLLALVPEEAVA